jgi:hypothetical protein
MCRTAEKHVDIVQRDVMRKAQIRFAMQSRVHVCNFVSRIAVAVYKNDFHIGVIDKQPYQFACRVSCSADYSCFYHFEQLNYCYFML